MVSGENHAPRSAAQLVTDLVARKRRGDPVVGGPDDHGRPSLDAPTYTRARCQAGIGRRARICSSAARRECVRSRSSAESISAANARASIRVSGLSSTTRRSRATTSRIRLDAGGRATLIDTSSNGTRLNGARIERGAPVRLKGETRSVSAARSSSFEGRSRIGALSVRSTRTRRRGPSGRPR